MCAVRAGHLGRSFVPEAKQWMPRRSQQRSFQTRRILSAKAVRHLPRQVDRQWSAVGWAELRKGWLFLSSTEDSREAAAPLQSVWLDCIVRRLMADDGSRGKVWIIADELPV